MTSSALRGHAIKGVAWLLSGTLTQNALHFFSLIILARLLTPRDFGLVSAALILIGLMKIFAELGVGPAIVRKPDLKDHDVATGVSTSIFLGVVFAGGLYLSADVAANFFGMDDLAVVIRTLSAMLPIAGLSVVGLSLLQRKLRFREMAALNVGAYIVAYGCIGIPMALLGYGVWSLVLAYLCQSVVITAGALLLEPSSRRVGFDGSSAGHLLNYGFGFSLARVANYAALQGDNVVVGRVLGADALGFYGRAYQLMSLPASMFAGVLDRVLFPVMATIQNEDPRLGSIYVRATGIVSMVALPASTLLIVCAEDIVRVLLGTQWDEVVVPLQVLAVCLTFRMAYKVSDSVIKVKGAVYRRAWTQLAYAVLVVLGASLGAAWGISGVAAGVAIAVFVNYILLSLLVATLIPVRWRKVCGAYMRHLALAALIGSAAVGARYAYGDGTPGLALVITFVTAAGVMAAIHVAMRPLLGTEYAELLSLVTNLLKRPSQPVVP